MVEFPWGSREPLEESWPPLRAVLLFLMLLLPFHQKLFVPEGCLHPSLAGLIFSRFGA